MRKNARNPDFSFGLFNLFGKSHLILTFFFCDFNLPQNPIYSGPVSGDGLNACYLLGGVSERI